jgi:cytochrome P450
MGQPRIPSGPRGLLFVGNLIRYLRDPLGFLTACAREYGDVFRIRLLGMELYTISHPDAIEYVLRNNHRNFKKDYFTRQLSSLLGVGLLTSEGDFWRRQRQLAQPALQLSQLHHYGAVMVALTDRLLQNWQDGQQRDIHADMMGLALDIVAKTLLDAGVAGPEAGEVGATLEIAMKYLMSPLTWSGWRLGLPTPASRRYHRAIRRLDEIMYAFIRERRQAGPRADDLLSRLVMVRDDQGLPMNDDELRDELMTLFLAGHETTALAMSYCFHLLSEHPEAEARLTAEVDDVLGDRTATVADVPNLRYTEWVVREAMRLYPPAWAIGREALADCEIGGFHVPKGTQVQLVQWIVHRDPRWFEEPESFRPERWDNDLARRLPRCAYFPFGDGPRICIGYQFAMLESVLVLATITRRFRLAALPGQTLRLIPSVTLRPKHGIRLVVQGRNNRRSYRTEATLAGAKDQERRTGTAD